MEKRDFLKNIFLAAGLSQLPLSGWGKGFSALLESGVNPGSEFSLLKLEKLLAGYQIPAIDRFSTSTFNLGYKMYNLYGDTALYAGEFLLHSSAQGNIRQFDFTHWRWADNGSKSRLKKFKYLVSGSVWSEANDALTPREWKVTSRISLSEEGAPYGGTGWFNSGKAQNGMVTIQTNGQPIRKAFGQTLLGWKWGLPAVVQQMAEASKVELQFALLDEFDAIYQNQKLSFRKNVKLDCGEGGLIDCKVFELTGDGVIPTVYWVDDQHRTIFVISGMEAYVLN